MRIIFILTVIAVLSVKQVYSQKIDNNLSMVLRLRCLSNCINGLKYKEVIIQKQSFKNGLKKYLIHYSNEQTKIDSIVFNYDSINNLIEQVEYYPSGDSVSIFKEVTRIKFYYDNERKLIDIKGSFNTVQLYHKKDIWLMYRDPLDLLEDEMEDLQIGIDNSKSKNLCNSKNKDKTLRITCYIAAFRLRTFERYGVPQSALLNSIKTFARSNSLVKDEFYFNGFTVKRQYEYLNSLPKRIIVSIKPFNKKPILYSERFEYIYSLAGVRSCR